MSVAARRQAAAARGARALLVVGVLALGCERGSTAQSRAPEDEAAAPAVRGDEATGAVAEGAGEPEAAAIDGDELADGPPVPEDEAAPEARCAPQFTEELLTILGPIDGLVFEYDKAVIKPQSYAVLDHIAEVLLDNPEVRIQIDGHRDADPRWRERAVEITRRRAESVRRYLVHKGVPADRLEARGFGPTQPRAANDTKENRALNRRVELHAPELPDDPVPCPASSAAD